MCPRTPEALRLGPCHAPTKARSTAFPASGGSSMVRLLLVSAFFVSQAAHAAPDRPSPLLTSPEAKDALTYAAPEIARVTHVDLDLTADFEAHVMRGTAALDILAGPDARQIILDDNKLAIS